MFTSEQIVKFLILMTYTGYNCVETDFSVYIAVLTILVIMILSIVIPYVIRIIRIICIRLGKNREF